MRPEAMSVVVHSIALQGVLRAGFVATVLAVIGNALIFILGEGILRINFVVPPPPGSTEPFRVTVTSVIVDTILMGVGATLIFALVVRISAHPNRVFIVISAVILLVSFMFPLLLRVDVPMKIALCLMHCVAAAILVGVFTRGLTKR